MTRRTVLAAVALIGCSAHGAATDAPRGDASRRDAGATADAAACVPPPDAAPVDAGAAPATCTTGVVPGSCLEVATCYGSRTPTAGECAGSAGIQCCTPRFADGVTCDPNATPQPNACLVEDPGDAGCPAGMTRIAASPAYCVDRFEASLVDASTGAPWSPYLPPPATGGMRAVSLRHAVPQGYISQVQATAACAAAGKRLCGAAMTQYPYGPTREPGTCNDARAVHPAIELYGTSDSWIFSHLDSPCLNQEAAGLDRTGALAGCVTAEGAFDMMGNLHEWTADPAGTFRGGYYVDTVENGSGCDYVTTAHDVSYSDYSTGFRCCADASP
jgi:hypothetical protein